MRILLINPVHNEVYSKVPSAQSISPPLGLTYLASFTRSRGYEVNLIDAAALNMSNKVLETTLRGREFDVVGVSSMTPSIHRSADVLEMAKTINPSCFTIMGGPHATAVPEETLRYFPFVDYVALGEGEMTFIELIGSLSNGSDPEKITGLAYLNNGEYHNGGKRELIKDLDAMPLPAFDMLPMHKYCLPAHHTSYGGYYNLKPFFLTLTSRGCPYNCTFCASPIMWGRMVRFRGVDKILEEIDILVNEYGVRCLEFADDIFTLKKNRMHEILDRIIDNEYRISFNCLSRVDAVDRDMLLKLKQAGCYLIRFGIESGSQKMLDKMKKGTRIEQIKDTFKLLNKVKIHSLATFIIGHPGETRETVLETIKLAKSIKPSAALFFNMVPLVGTESCDMVSKNNLIITENWFHWKQIADIPFVRTEELTGDEILELRKLAFRKFYFTPYFMLKTLISIRSIAQLKFYINGLKAICRIVISKSVNKKKD